ncbi:MULTISPECIES: hypothetical protein [unclassified Cellulophaga]|uniref:hypothetical protein n=1 Tax=unclassified Cellulophaga TaxID=2634405 RepID=UPI0026E3526D|nr:MULTISPECIES: hypothetical protein [unclassified Cellulophaga]MDO6491387.1 hypothetical protein [Cellulophaga sp. 2_MG-2023]MDO6495080.1 hypothetical protein [Cellulophaga sp. 3_MG-2023]
MVIILLNTNWYYFVGLNIYENIKLIIGYILWAITIYLWSLGVVRLWMGAQEVGSTFLKQLMAWGYGLTLMIDSVLIATISIITFILLDLFYLKKRTNQTKPIIFKLISALALTIVVAVLFLGVEYFLVHT